jgi:hypothetical protein
MAFKVGPVGHAVAAIFLDGVSGIVSPRTKGHILLFSRFLVWVG